MKSPMISVFGLESGCCREYGRIHVDNRSYSKDGPLKKKQLFLITQNVPLLSFYHICFLTLSLLQTY